MLDLDRPAIWAFLTAAVCGLTVAACEDDAGKAPQGDAGAGAAHDGGDAGEDASHVPDGDASSEGGGSGGMDSGGDADGGPLDGAGPADADTPRDWDAAFGHLFPTDHVVDLRLTFAPGDFVKLLEDWQTNGEKVEYPAAFQFDTEKLASIGVRLKGLNGLNLPPGPIDPTGKYPLKLDFNATGGDRFYGVDGMSLNTNLQDPSLMRERLALSMYREMGIPSSRAAYAKVSVDGHVAGLYTAVQLIDKRYLKERFGTKNDADDGNLYKCVYNSAGVCSLEWRGSSKADYYLTDCPAGFDECGIVQKTNEDDPAQNDYADFIHFLDVLHHTPEGAFQAEIQKVFDVDSFLRVSAVAFAISNSDSYFGKGHNYYLYRHPDTGRFQYLPWDLDLTYGTTSCEADIGDPTCGQAASHPLVGKLLAVPAFRAKYLEYLALVVEQHLTRTKHQAWIADLDALLRPLLSLDRNIPGEAEYDAAQEQLLTFVDLRREDILSRLPKP